MSIRVIIDTVKWGGIIMNTRKYDYFLKVCEKGNITLAANELFISRSVLSRALHELEEEYGTTLFTRSKQGVELTKSGIIIRDMLNSIYANYKYAQDQLTEIKRQNATDIIRIGITPTNGLPCYKRFLSKFMQDHPDIKIYIEEHSAFDICTLLMEHSLDAGISPVIYGAESLNKFVLYDDTLMLGMRKSDPLSKKKEISLPDLTDLPLGFLTSKIPMEGIIKEYLSAQHKKANIVIRTSDRDLLYHMTIDGAVYPFLTKNIMSSWKGVCFRKVSFVTPSIVNLLWPVSTDYRPALKTFIDFMKDNALEYNRKNVAD